MSSITQDLLWEVDSYSAGQ